ncbi:Unknown protein, partial [Striga hermonthica]
NEKIEQNNLSTGQIVDQSIARPNKRSSNLIDLSRSSISQTQHSTDRPSHRR